VEIPMRLPAFPVEIAGLQPASPALFVLPLFVWFSLSGHGFDIKMNQ
jgi:hypothetical protein